VIDSKSLGRNVTDRKVGGFLCKAYGEKGELSKLPCFTGVTHFPPIQVRLYAV
jgi:hypothetical protein